MLDLYRYNNFNHRYSDFIDLDLNAQSAIRYNLKNDNDLLVQLISFCVMPTHFHLILQQEQDQGIVKFISKVLNSYSKYFNQRHKRNGPLWSSRFKSVHIINDEQLLHLTRYIHLNPTSAGLVERPEEWEYSSYKQFIKKEDHVYQLCKHEHLLDIEPRQYKKFVDDGKSYQRNLSIIKKLIIEDYTG